MLYSFSNICDINGLNYTQNLSLFIIAIKYKDIYNNKLKEPLQMLSNFTFL